MEKTNVGTPDRFDTLRCVFQTEHFRVVIGTLRDLPETPAILARRYIIVNVEDGVVLGLAGSRGGAVVAALQAEQELSEAARISREMAARAPEDARNPFLDPSALN